MAHAFFWLAVLCCVIAQVAITRSALRPHPRRDDSAADVPLPHRASEVAWTLVPAVMLAFVLLLTWNALHVPPPAHHEVPAPSADVRAAS